MTRDQRIYDTVVVLVSEGGERTLTAEESKLVIDNFETVAHEATKWRLMRQRTGRLLLINADLVAAVSDYLSARDQGLPPEVA